MAYQLLASLLPLLEQFEQQATPGTAEPQAALAAFAQWLPAQLAPSALSAAPAHPAARIAPNPHETMPSLLSKLVTFLYRYLRSYSRLALADTPLVSFDDFSCLMTVFASGPRTKTELMQLNMHEKATGTEIIKRLLKNGLMQEKPHPRDRRSKLLHLTPLGQGLLLTVLPRMSQVADLGAGNLTPDELAQLVHLLHKLDAFHHPIFLAPRAEDFEAFMAQRKGN